jgi:hypothetical protein
MTTDAMMKHSTVVTRGGVMHNNMCKILTVVLVTVLVGGTADDASRSTASVPHSSVALLLTTYPTATTQSTHDVAFAAYPHAPQCDDMQLRGACDRSYRPVRVCARVHTRRCLLRFADRTVSHTPIRVWCARRSVRRTQR